MLPTKWPKAPIESLCTRVTSGGTPSRSNAAFYEGGTIPWIKTGELRGWYVDAISERITPTAVKGSSAKVFPAETVLLAMYGDGRTMGSVGLTRAPAATNQACCAMLTDTERCVPKFLMYALMHYKPALLKLAISGAQRNLSGKSIKEFEIGAPPVEIQRRIASILSAYDDLIENNTRRIAILEEMARRLYEEWFVRFRFPGHEDVRMIESEMGLIPEGWYVDPLEKVCPSKDGIQTGPFGSQLHKSDYSSEGVPVLMPKDLLGFRVNTETIARIPEATAQSLPRHRMKPGDIVYGRRGDIGRRAFIMAHQSGWFCGTGCLRIRPDPAAINGWYLFNYFGQDNVVGLIAGRAHGVTMPNLNTRLLESVPVVRPPRSLQDQFEQVTFPTASLRETLIAKNRNLRTTRDLLLPKLISGELDVSTLPEPQAETA